MSRENLREMLQDAHKGTTIFAMRFTLTLPPEVQEQIVAAGGEVAGVPAVVIAGDGRTTDSYIASDKGKKIYPIDSKTALGTAGICFIIHELAKLFKLQVQHHDDLVDRPDQELTLRGKARMLENMVRELAFYNFPIGFILAGYEESEGRCRIFDIGGDGFAIDKEDFGGTGSGYPPIQALLGEKAGKEYSQQEVVEIVSQLFNAAFSFDHRSGGRCRASIITPFGVEEVASDE